MSTITINDDLYRSVQRSAKLNNISLHNFVERALNWAVSKSAKGESFKYKLKPIDELHPVVRNLIGIGKDPNDKGVNVDADKERMEFLREKYGL